MRKFQPTPESATPPSKKRKASDDTNKSLDIPNMAKKTELTHAHLTNPVLLKKIDKLRAKNVGTHVSLPQVSLCFVLTASQFLLAKTGSSSSSSSATKALASRPCSRTLPAFLSHEMSVCALDMPLRSPHAGTTSPKLTFASLRDRNHPLSIKLSLRASCTRSRRAKSLQMSLPAS
jgi:hypothetical protein